jgi:hypothetical protein
MALRMVRRHYYLHMERTGAYPVISPWFLLLLLQTQTLANTVRTLTMFSSLFYFLVRIFINKVPTSSTSWYKLNRGLGTTATTHTVFATAFHIQRSSLRSSHYTR